MFYKYTELQIYMSSLNYAANEQICARVNVHIYNVSGLDTSLSLFAHFVYLLIFLDTEVPETLQNCHILYYII